MMKKPILFLLLIVSFILLTPIENQAKLAKTNTLKVPAVTTIKRLQPEHSGTGTVGYSVTFAESVTNLSIANFTLTTSGGISNASITNLTGSGSNYVVTVATGTGNGNIRLNLGNTNGIAQPHNVTAPITGETYLITKNFVNPVLRIQAENPLYDANSTMIDAVEVINADNNTIVNNALINASFENYDGKPTPFRYNPTGANWTFNGWSGVAENGGGFNPAITTDGTTAVFLQSFDGVNGLVAQTLTLASGNYKIRFKAARRSGNPQAVNLFINDVFMGVIIPSSDIAYELFTSDVFNAETVLSVQFNAFTAKAEARGAKLAWSTSSEKQNSHFLIERSNNGIDFTTLQKVQGSGTTDETKFYTTYDLQPLNGINYYRLSQVDLDGKLTLLATKSVNFNLSANSVSIFPNPTTDLLKVNFAANYYTQLQIVSLDGKSLHQANLGAADTNYELNIQAYAKGTYLVVLKGNKEQYSHKIIKR